MLKLISPRRAEKIIDRYGDWIEDVSERYGVPAPAIKAILYQEMTQIDLADPLADFAARIGLFGKKDSSTGFAQVFGFVGVNAINFAVDRGLATYGSLGVVCDHRLDPNNAADVRLVWRKLHRDPKANIELAALNLLVAADEMTGRTDFSTFSDEELKLVFTRYNANVKHVTAYGESVFARYKSLL